MRFARVLIGFAGLALATTAWGAKFNRVVDIGDVGFAWRGVPGIDGKPHSLGDLSKSKLVVLIFMSNHCPVVKGYEARLNRLVADFTERGVSFVGINCSLEESDSLDAMRERAQVAEFALAWLKDESQVSARKYGATATPQVFVLDADRKIAYMGAIDSDRQGKSIDHHYLRDALEALLDGRAPEVTETRAIGCGIGYRDE